MIFKANWIISSDGVTKLALPNIYRMIWGDVCDYYNKKKIDNCSLWGSWLLYLPFILRVFHGLQNT